MVWAPWSSRSQRRGRVGKLAGVELACGGVDLIPDHLPEDSFCSYFVSWKLQIFIYKDKITKTLLFDHLNFIVALMLQVRHDRQYDYSYELE